MAKKSLILLVDDNPGNIQVLGGVLSDEGYNPAGVSSGEEAVKFLTKRKPDLILLDVLMSELDGYETCRKIREDSTNENIPIIFLTARTNEEDMVKGFDAGAVDYVTKPFNVPVLLARVKTHIGLKQAREQLYELSVKDDLTGLYNRRYFKEELLREMNRAKRHNIPLVLALIDIDHFKKINDTFGHETGDRALKALALLFGEIFRLTDRVCRIGGEEFAVVLPDSDLKGAMDVSERFRREVESRTGEMLDGVSSFTISMGVTLYIDEMIDVDAMLRESDKALYRAKDSGRNTICISGKQNR